MSTHRRGRGEGSIYKRRDGRWAARISTGYAHGRRSRMWIYGATRQDVADKLTAALRAQQQGMLVAPERLTVQQFLSRWLDDSARPKLRPRTFDSYVQVVRLHIEPVLGRIPLQKLGPQQVQKWLNELQAAGLSPRTCQYARAILRSALNQALRWGQVSRNVATLVEGPRVPRHEIRPLQPAEARQLLAVAATNRWGALVSVALALGLRLGEALGLKWNAVDLDTGTLTIRAALQRVRRRGLLLVEPKSARSHRTIALPDVAAAALKAHRVRQLEQRMAGGYCWQDTGFVFTTKHGKPVDPRNATRHFHRLLRDAGLTPVRFHDLRHTAATLLHAQGVDPRTIMEILGHSQISLTLNTYTHVLPALQRDAARQMDRALRG